MKTRQPPPTPLPAPPRRLTLAARLAVLFSEGDLVFRVPLLSLMLAFFWGLTMESTLIHSSLDGRRLEVRRARIVSAEATLASDDEEDVVRYVYEYDVRGRVRSGRAYTTGWKWKEGQTLPVEVDPAQPDVSRLPGARPAMFLGYVGILGITLPLCAMLPLVLLVAGNRRKVELLVHGKLVEGKVVRRATFPRVDVEDDLEYEYEVEFRDEHHRVQQLTFRSDCVSRQAAEPLLYDPREPGRALLLNDLPLVPNVDRDGVLRLGPGLALRVLWLPVLSLSPHVAFALWRYGPF